jgi:hypothetical protein
MILHLDPRPARQPREMTREALRARAGHGEPGRYGRLFPDLDPLTAPDGALHELALAMRDPAPDDLAGDNPDIPAGHTYLGRFVEHDLTYDPTPQAAQALDPLSTAAYRTPALDLAALYGPGPSLTPWMFRRDPRTGQPDARLLEGRTGETPDISSPIHPMLPQGPHDLPRNVAGRALIPDERNDDHLVLAQTHLAFIRFHNRVVDMLEANRPGLAPQALFEEARRIVVRHYQWIVLHDLVERLTEPELIARLRREGRRFFRFRARPFLPAEFAVAAGRLGLAMGRQVYAYNRIFRPGRIPATDALMRFYTGRSGAILGAAAGAADPADYPGGPAPCAALPATWAIDWRRFHEMGGPATLGCAVNASRRIGPQIAPALHRDRAAEGREALRPFRELRRGVALELPAGQDVARAMGVERLSEADVAAGPDGDAAHAAGLTRRTPLWHYLLKEAQVFHEGRRLGPVGATLLAETVLGLLEGDPESFLNDRAPWTPELPRADAETFTMADLLAFAGETNPLG